MLPTVVDRLVSTPAGTAGASISSSRRDRRQGCGLGGVGADSRPSAGGGAVAEEEEGPLARELRGPARGCGKAGEPPPPRGAGDRRTAAGRTVAAGRGGRLTLAEHRTVGCRRSAREQRDKVGYRIWQGRVKQWRILPFLEAHPVQR